MQNLNHVIAQALSRDDPRAKVRVQLRSPDGSLHSVIGRIYEDRVVDEDRHEVWPFSTFEIERFF